MKLRIIAILLLAVMLVGCSSNSGNSALTEEQAVAIALEDAGVTQADVTGLHTHLGLQDDTPVYSVHFYIGQESFGYVINAVTGEILSVGGGH